MLSLTQVSLSMFPLSGPYLNVRCFRPKCDNWRKIEDPKKFLPCILRCSFSDFYEKRKNWSLHFASLDKSKHSFFTRANAVDFIIIIVKISDTICEIHLALIPPVLMVVADQMYVQMFECFYW